MITILFYICLQDYPLNKYHLIDVAGVEFVEGRWMINPTWGGNLEIHKYHYPITRGDKYACE